jgi:hypothetical protein
MELPQATKPLTPSVNSSLPLPAAAAAASPLQPAQMGGAENERTAEAGAGAGAELLKRFESRRNSSDHKGEATTWNATTETANSTKGAGETAQAQLQQQQQLEQEQEQQQQQLQQKQQEQNPQEKERHSSFSWVAGGQDKKGGRLGERGGEGPAWTGEMVLAQLYFTFRAVLDPSGVVAEIKGQV